MIGDWRTDIDESLSFFLDAATIAGASVSRRDLQVEYLAAPHRPPSRLPTGSMAVYAFWGSGHWLKIGKVGPNSGPRFTSQHYSATSSNSNLAKSLSQDQACLDWLEFNPTLPGDWIKSQCHRVNIYMGDHHPKALLSFLEVFLHLRLKPRYEG